jgi:pyruvate,water dikinase
MHEKAVEEMFSLGVGRKRALGGAKKLTTGLPITIYVLDLGGGLRSESARRKTITLEDIVNLPLKILWRGLNHPSVHWSTEVRHFDWEEFDRISAGIVSFESQLLSSFALVSVDYLNINIRFGYHFVVLDTLCGDGLSENTIALRFEGGGATYEGRRLRALFMERVLRNLGFHVHREGDMIESQLKGASFKTAEEGLKAVGRLLGATRLLDMRLKGEEDVDRLAAEFHNRGRE